MASTSKPDPSTPPFAAALAAAVRARRERAGLSQGELARMAGVSTGTLSVLEAGLSNPTVGTLWAVAGVLGCTVADLLGDADDPMVQFVKAGEGTHFEGSVSGAQMLHRFSPNGPVEVYEVHLEPLAQERSDPHGEGVYEHVFVASGSIKLGPEDHPFDMRAGDYVCFQGWVPHVYSPGRRGARLVLLLSYTRSLWVTRLLGHGDVQLAALS